MILAALLCGCATTAVDDTGGLDGAVDHKSGTDGTVSDTGSGSDSATNDSGDDGAVDGAVDDAGDDGSISIDAGPPPDGGMCPPCQMPLVCCKVMKSPNYLKCYNSACLACCM